MFSEKIYEEALDETVYGKKLKNGLAVFVMPKKGYAKQFASFTTHFGSNDLFFKQEENQPFYEAPQGIAHFLEHKMFEEKEGNAFDRFVEYGASVNAFTNFNTTAYYFTTTSHFTECLHELMDFVQTPYFTDENVEKEKGIIAQEIKMYQDQPQWQVYFGFLKAMYDDHPVKNDIAGTVETIYTITKEKLYHCYHTFYHPSNMVLFTAGDFDPETVFEQVEAYFSKQESKSAQLLRKPITESNDIKEANHTQEMGLSMPLFNLGYKDGGASSGGREILKKEAALRLLLDLLLGDSSPLYQRLYGEGLINGAFQYDCIVELGYAYSLISGESDKPETVRDYLNQAVLEMKEKGINETDFKRILKKQIGEYLSSFNSLEYVGNSFVTYYLNESNFLEYLQVLKEVTTADLKHCLAQHFDKRRQVLSVVR